MELSRWERWWYRWTTRQREHHFRRALPQQYQVRSLLDIVRKREAVKERLLGAHRTSPKQAEVLEASLATLDWVLNAPPRDQ